jgi:glycosyltransferase involved in cell wall biosynthesis
MRIGGLVAYTEDLMREQLRRGHEVAYFFAGRHHPFMKRPWTRRWETDGLLMIEVVDSPLYDHGRQPELELDEPRIDAMLRRVIDERRPDVVHVHELAGLPSSLLDVTREAGVPCAFTLQDYFPLCSTFKLFDAGGQVCLRRDIGEDCVATVAADPRTPGVMVEGTVRFELHDRRLFRDRLSDERIEKLAERAAATVKRPPAPGAGAYQRRRDVNVERLSRVDRLIAMSSRVAEIYTHVGVDHRNMQTLQLTLAHIERLRPRTPSGTPPVVFGTLNGMQSVAKGGRLLLDAVRQVADSAEPGSFRVLAFGFVNHDFDRELDELRPFERAGFYGQNQLDALLEPVDVGIVPSVWEEAYGYVGPEFIAKGIPVIGNAIGGIPEYTRDGETGWLNQSCSADELARIMLEAIERPAHVVELNARIRAARSELLKPFARHADEMDAIYTELARPRR